MVKVRGTSNVPMVLGIVGGVLGLPAAVCSGACAAGLTATSSAGNTFMALGLIAAVLAIIFAILSKKSPIIAGAGLLVATVLSAITLVTFNFLTLVEVILLLLAAIFAFVQKKETVE